MMNLQLNPAQTLALYEMIVSVMTNSSNVEMNTMLSEVKQKLHASILDVLQQRYSSTNKDKFSTWFDKEQTKIAQLNTDLVELRIVSPKKQINELDKPVKSKKKSKSTSR